MDYAKQISVIESTLTRRGKGVDGDPVRIVTQYFSLDGELLAEVDRHQLNSFELSEGEKITVRMAFQELKRAINAEYVQGYFGKVYIGKLEEKLLR